MKRKLSVRERAKNFLKTYEFGVDLWAVGLFCGTFLLNLLSWCLMPHVYLLKGGNAGMYAAAYVFLALAGLTLCFLRKRGEGRDPDFGSPFFLFFCLFAVLGVSAWGFYLAAYVNWAVLLFLAVFPAAAHAMAAVLRKNWFALVPTAVSFALFLSVAILCIVAL